MKDARYLIRLANTESRRPVDAGLLLGQARAWVLSRGGRVINLRVSSRALEFDLFLPDGKSLDEVLSTLHAWGPVLTKKRLDIPSPAVMVPQSIVDEARHLWNEERYWEVHDVLEDLWKHCTGAEKQLVQGLILAAAALVHRQKNENAIMPSMIQDALKRLDDQPSHYYGWDIASFRSSLHKLLYSSDSIPTV